jgi:hypothetical protein
MTTETIAILANRGQIASGDFNLAETLRYEVVPEFFGELPEAVWRRRYNTLTVTQGDRGATTPYDLGDDFYSMVAIWVPYADGTLTHHGIAFIGEDPAAIAAAEASSTQGSVGGYYIVPRASDQEFKGLKFSIPPDRSFSAPYSYIAYPYFGNAAQAVEMNQWIPEPLQHGLIHLLRAKIYLDRYGEGDQRAAGAMNQYERVLARVREKYALSRRSHSVYVS